MSQFEIFPDKVAFEQVKPGSRAHHQKAFGRLHEFLNQELEDSLPSEQNLPIYLGKYAMTKFSPAYSLIYSVFKGSTIWNSKVPPGGKFLYIKRVFT